MSKLKLDPREVQKAIRQLEACDLNHVTVKDAEQLLTPLFKGYTVRAPVFNEDTYLYRARICAKPSRLSDISYPPDHLIKQRGRANDVGESLFYASTTRNTPFFELNVKSGDLVALSQWKTGAPITLNHVGFSSESQAFDGSARPIDHIYSFVAETREMSDLNALVHNYIASKFSERINEANKVKYKLTVAIGRKLLGNNGLLDGIIYPTIQMRGNADNIVLSKEAADRTLRFVSVEYLEVVEAKDFSYGVNCLDSATRIDLIGTIHWSGRQLQWKLKSKGDELKMLSNGIEWIAYDPMGRRVDPE